MLTDNGASYRSRAYRDVLERFEIRHKRTRPYRPLTNGKAECLTQTLINEPAYPRPYRSHGDRLHASAASSTSAITDVRTPRSEASCVARLSTTSPSTTPGRRPRDRGHGRTCYRTRPMAVSWMPLHVA
jgi:transposase InsO family protein